MEIIVESNLGLFMNLQFRLMLIILDVLQHTNRFEFYKNIFFSVYVSIIKNIPIMSSENHESNTTLYGVHYLNTNDAK